MVRMGPVSQYPLRALAVPCSSAGNHVELYLVLLDDSGTWLGFFLHVLFFGRRRRSSADMVLRRRRRCVRHVYGHIALIYDAL